MKFCKLLRFFNHTNFTESEEKNDRKLSRLPITFISGKTTLAN